MTKLVSTRRTPWVRGPSAVTDAMLLGGVTEANDIYFERVVVYLNFVNRGFHAIMDPIGATIDAVVSSGTAIAASFTQEADASGLLGNFMEFVVEVEATDEGGQVTDSVIIPMQSIVDQGAAGIEVIVQNIANRLRAAVGG